jgi:hypothetical protein
MLPTAPRSLQRRLRERGQVVIIFAGAMILFAGLCAAVIDISWYWTNNLRMQRAADAAALAGAVYLPGDTNRAFAMARAEALKNGYASPEYTVTPVQDPGNDRRLTVTINGQVGTYFARVVGITSWTAQRAGSAEYVLPVPMGSPENYYGVGVLNLRQAQQQTVNDETDWSDAGSWPGGGPWSDEDEADDNNNDDEADSGTGNGNAQRWAGFGLRSGGDAIPGSAVIDGIEVRMRTRLGGSGNPTSDCRLRIELNWNNGASNAWTSALQTNPLSTSERTDNFGDDNSLSMWGGHSWDPDDFDELQVRLTFVKNNCGGSRRALVDVLEVRVSYHTTVTTLAPPAPVDVNGPNGQDLNPQRFWGAMQSQGAPGVQGDAYMAGYTTRKSPTNPEYDPRNYYNYGIEIFGSGGQVWLFDPGFCDTSTYDLGGGNRINQGTGEFWTLGNPNGSNTAQPISAQFNLYNTNDTPYTLTDDTLVASTGNTFRRMFMRDPDLGGNSGGDYGNPQDCRTTSWHNRWWAMPGAQNLPAGTYRLHTTSRIYSNPAAGTLDGSDNQTDSTGVNAFAIWTTSSGGVLPRVYGIGAMEAYFPLPGNQTSTFYLAQVDAVHAGKWVDIDLWDPGDTGDLTADLSFLPPGSNVGTSFHWNQSLGTTKPTNFACGPQTSGAVSSIRTSSGSGGIFNGRWLRICIRLADDYSAPIDPGSGEPGWWRIRYQMSNSGASTDLTTWQVNIRGNPVHLVLN